MNVGIVLHNGVELMDFAGPGEVFSVSVVEGAHPFRVFTLGKTRDPVMIQDFLTCVPEYDVNNCPRIDLLIIPGGSTRIVLADLEMMEWLGKVAETAQIILTVCTGALVLAKLGMLDGKDVTTWHGRLETLRTMAPKAVVHDNTRWVDNGRIVTTAGVSAGIDGALHLVKRLHGLDVALATARYMEYDSWNPNAGLRVD